MVNIITSIRKRTTQPLIVITRPVQCNYCSNTSLLAFVETDGYFCDFSTEGEGGSAGRKVDQLLRPKTFFLFTFTHKCGFNDAVQRRDTRVQDDRPRLWRRGDKNGKEMFRVKDRATGNIASSFKYESKCFKARCRICLKSWMRSHQEGAIATICPCECECVYLKSVWIIIVYNSN